MLRICRTLAALALTSVPVLACGSESDGDPTKPAVPSIHSVVISAAATELEIGDTTTITAVALDEAGNPLSGREPIWSSSAPEVLTVSTGGWARALSAGRAIVKATIGARSGEILIEVDVPAPASVAFSQDSLVLFVGAADSMEILARDKRGESLEATFTFTRIGDDNHIRTGSWIEGTAPGRSILVGEVGGLADSLQIVVHDVGGLTDDDAAAVTAALDSLVARYSVAPADRIIAVIEKDTYGVPEWAGFLTRDLANRRDFGIALVRLVSVGRRASDVAETRFRQALIQAASVRATAFARAAPLATLARGMPADPALTEQLQDLARFSNDFLLVGGHPVPDVEADGFDAIWRDLFGRHPQLIVDPPPELAEMWRLLAGALLRARPLGPTRKDEIAAILHMAPSQRRLLQDFGVLANPRRPSDETTWEDGRVDDEHLGLMHDHLSLLPYSGLKIVYGQQCCFARLGEGGVAVGSLDLGNGWSENTFPDDAEARTIPGFASIWTHEVHHLLDYERGVYARNAYGARRAQLIEQAGDDPLNYLRATGEGFFASNPIELIASLSQMYVVDSRNTLDLALARLEGGRAEPLNQFLFMAEIYAEGRSTTYLYEMDEEGRLTRTEAPVTRNANGDIDGIDLGEEVRTFVLDADGNVLSTSVR